MLLTENQRVGSNERAARRGWRRCHGWAATTLSAGMVVATLVAAPRRAEACGGCFVATESTVVTDHRMAFSISTRQTVLWDQIRYSGDPAEFSWVLPVHPGARVEASRDEWFAALEATTQPTIVGPSSRPTGGAGCGSSDDAASAAFGDARGVEVVHQEVVGPYESVTLRSGTSGALEAWLTEHGYTIPASIQPTLDAYTQEGFDFIALRLRPGQGVRAMKPVRIVTDGADASLPLRMVAAGVGANVGITLYVLGEGRYHPQNFPDVTVDDRALTWDASQGRSNYQELSQAAMRAGDGRGWLTESSSRASLSGITYGPGTAPAASGPGSSFFLGGAALDQIYYGSCTGPTAPTAATLASDAGDGGSDADTDAAVDGSIDAATGDAADAGGASDRGDAGDVRDAGEGSDAGACLGGLCTPCSAFDDLRVATLGMHASDLWVTRLRANLPVAALKVGDLRVEATRDQSPVSNVHYVPSVDGDGCATAPRTGGGTWASIAGAIFGVAAILRQRRAVARR
jgi:hypothetical protein